MRFTTRANGVDPVTPRLAPAAPSCAFPKFLIHDLSPVEWRAIQAAREVRAVLGQSAQSPGVLIGRLPAPSGQRAP